MSIFKCKMCGGDLNITEGQTVAECEYCGTKQTVPIIDNEKTEQLFIKANKLRFNCEFDKASALYEEIISDSSENAEAYWGAVLCKYGVEYVEDPESHIHIPTIHRAQYKSILEDENYKSALAYSDTYQKTVFEEQALAIDTAQKGILDISKSEKPYDIFICYKETDKNGQRTEDSVLAYDIYDKLTEKGYKVFFSRITLDSKIGQEYEPYIFSALNSAKVMLVVGTKPEYFDAVWVRNEWKRYLEIISADKSKTIIPCYKNMNPQYLPDELKHIQSVDLGKIGAVQDILIGVNKLINSNVPISDSDNSEKKSNKNNKKFIIPVAAVLFALILVFGISSIVNKDDSSAKSNDSTVTQSETVVSTEASEAVPAEDEVKERFIEYTALRHKWFYETSVNIDYDTVLDTETVIYGTDYSTAYEVALHPVNDDEVKTKYDLDTLFLSYTTKENYETFSTIFGNYDNYDGKLCIATPVDPFGYTDYEEVVESSVKVAKNSDEDFTVTYEVVYSHGEDGTNGYSVHYTKTSDGYRFGEDYSEGYVSALKYGNYKVTTKGSDLTVRESPDKNSDKIGSLKNGFVVLVKSSTKEWAYIEYYPTEGSFKNGWVSVDYLMPAD